MDNIYVQAARGMIKKHLSPEFQKFSRIVFQEDDGFTIARIHYSGTNATTGPIGTGALVGVAKLHPDDKPDPKRGRMLALKRAIHSQFIDKYVAFQDATVIGNVTTNLIVDIRDEQQPKKPKQTPKAKVVKEIPKVTFPTAKPQLTDMAIDSAALKAMYTRYAEMKHGYEVGGCLRCDFAVDIHNAKISFRNKHGREFEG